MSKKPELFLDFHGRFIDALGIQMYQKPAAAIAELMPMHGMQTPVL